MLSHPRSLRFPIALGIGLLSLSLAVPSPAAEIGLRVRFGLRDTQTTRWDGTVSAQPGRVTYISGWRFAQGDQPTGTAGWKAATRRAQPANPRTNNPQRAAARGRTNAPAGLLNDNGVILSLADVTEDSQIKIQTLQGEFQFLLQEVPYGKVLQHLDGAVEVERCAASTPLADDPTDDDFAAGTLAPDGTLYLAYTSFTPGLKREDRARSFTEEPKDFSFLAQPAGGDQLWLRIQRGKEWMPPLALTPGQGDIYKSACAVDGQGRAWVIWSERQDNQFDLWARSYHEGKLSPPQRLTDSPESDLSPVTITDAQGRVWIAWQGARQKTFRILARRQTGDGLTWSPEQLVSSQSGHCWTPALAATRPNTQAKVAVVWDTYDKGDYDIWMREFDLKGRGAPAEPVINTPDYEARPSATYDQAGNLWVAWEQSGPTWGKNWGALVLGQGIPLYQDRQIALRVLRNGLWAEPTQSHTQALPGATRRRRVNPQRVPSPEPEGESRPAAREAQARAAQAYNNLSCILTDRDGRVWLLARSRLNDFRSPIGSVWAEFAAYYNGDSWTGPILVPHTDNLLYNLPVALASPDGGLILAHSTDHRQRRQLQRRGQGGNASLEASNDPYQNDLYLSRLPLTGPPQAPAFRGASTPPDLNAAPSPATLKERSDIARIRTYRSTLNGQSLRILRGEFHRHTEISGDGGNDGPLEDMWRYAIDVAAMDWIGNGDHDNGNAREYTWWLTQKTTDAFHLPGAFDPLFSYERSVRYPEGHRNVIFAQRGIRTLPRLPKQNETDPGPAPDTQMLYKYLRHFNGICASHTSATDMGTDWRDHDPQVEPFVEIYQGCRQNYERPNAPRAPTQADAIGGWRPKGFVNLALLKGYKLAFQSSSDHRSTHISYCLVYATNASREAIFHGMKSRHTYAATDNIIANLRCTAGGRDYLMGDHLTTASPPTLRVHLIGTAPFAKIVVIKDDQEVHQLAPDQPEVQFDWTDPAPASGQTSYYYVRGEQTDGELVWASPLWIHYEPAANR